MNVRQISRNNNNEKPNGKTYESNVGLSLDKESTLQSTSGVHEAEVYHLPTAELYYINWRKCSGKKSVAKNMADVSLC